MTDQTFDRRRVLELSATGTTLAAAGCLSQLSDSDPFQGDRGELAADERRVTMAVALDQQALREKQIEVQEQIQSGNMTRQEAQTEMESYQGQLVDEAFQTVLDEFESLDITIENTLDRGLMLVAGPATALIDAVDTDVIEAIVGEDLFEQAEQAAQSPEAGTGGANETQDST